MKHEFFSKLIDILSGKKTKDPRKLPPRINIGYVKFGAIVFLILCLGTAFHFSGFDIDIKCKKSEDTCSIVKTLAFDNRPYTLSRFNISRIVDVFVDVRDLEDGSQIYDILLNYGPYEGQVFLDYGFNSKIKANTVKMKLARYLDNQAETLTISKRCYFNNYFCF